MATVNKNNVFTLPSEIIENIMSYCNYDNLSNSRLVCKFFNDTCQRLLNNGFSKVDKYHARIQKIVKNKLPRRESERRNHPLRHHVNALSAIETRLSLLNMTYMKYIDMQLCCFIPGKVLDEMFRVLDALADISTSPRTHELLQELRDISSMAMEHFDEKIAPQLRTRMPNCLSTVSSTSALTPQLSSATELNYHVVPWTSPTQQLAITRPPQWRLEINSIKASLRATSTSMIGMKKDVTNVKNCESEQARKIVDQERRLRDQSRIINEQGRKLAQQEQSMRELVASNLEYENKLTEVYREIAKLRSEVGLEASDNIAKALSCKKVSKTVSLTKECESTSNDVLSNTKSQTVDKSHEEKSRLKEQDLLEESAKISGNVRKRKRGRKQCTADVRTDRPLTRTAKKKKIDLKIMTTPD